MTSESDLGLEYVGNDGGYHVDDSELRQINKKLKEDYNSLKHQFDEAVKVTEQVDALCEQNSSLSKRNRDLQAKIDELERRIEISSRLNDEPNSKLQQEKQSTDAFITRETEALRQQLEAKEKELADLKYAAERENTNAQNALKSLEKEKAERNSDIEHLLQSASRRFSVKFTSLTLLSDYLLQAPVEQRHCVVESTKSNEKAKVAKLKQKNKDLRSSNKLLEAQLAAVTEKMGLLKRDNETEANKAIETANEAKREQKLAEMKSQQVIEQLQKEKCALEEQVAAQKAKLSEMVKNFRVEPAPVEGPKVAELNAKIEEMTEDLIKASKCTKKMQKRASAFAEELQKCEEAHGKLKRRNAELKNELNEASARLSQAEDANKSLAEENDQLKDYLDASAREIASLNQQLLQTRAGLEKAQTESKRLGRMVDDLENDVTEKAAEVKGVRAANAEQQQKLAKCEAMIKEQADTIESMEASIKDLKKRHEQEKPTVVPEVIPQSSWFCTDFPKELSKAVADIAKNESVSASARLRQALATIARYYGNAIDDLEKRAAEAGGKAAKATDTVTALLEVINAHFGEAQLADDSLLVRAVDEKLAELCDDRDRLSVENAQLNESISALIAKLGVDNLATAFSKVGDILANVESQSAQVKKLKNQNKQLKKAHNQMVQKLKEAEKPEVDDRCQTKAQSEPVEEIEIYKLKVAALEQEVARLESEQKRKVEELQEEANDKIQLAAQQVEYQCKSEAAVAQQATSQELSRTTRQLKEAQAKIAKLKRRIEHVLDANVQLEKKVKLIRAEAHDTIKSLKDRFAEELGQAKNKHSADVNTLKAFLAQKDDEISNLSTALDESKQTVRHLVETKRRLECERNQFASKVASQNEEMNRERRLLESKMKTLAATTDLKMQDSLEDLAAKFEQEKRNIYHFGADLFKGFFDPRTQLTDASYRRLLESAKDELSRMQKQETNIRRLVGALHSESAEDALARTIAQ